MSCPNMDLAPRMLQRVLLLLLKKKGDSYLLITNSAYLNLILHDVEPHMC